MNSAIRVCAGLMLLGAGMGLCSCSSKTDKIVVTGAVSWKGEAIPDHGDIILHPEGNASMPDAGKIVNGRYRVETTAGRKTVQIFWSREKAVPVGVMGQKEREQMIPQEYNHKSTMRMEVKPDEKNEFDFHLPLKN